MKLSETYYEILKSREDLSDYVFHFTKGADAKNILNKILSDKMVKDIHNKGYICFTESPITMLPEMFNIFRRYSEPMYAPYGIGIKKDLFYNIGGRQVIYGTAEEGKLLESIGMKWRFLYLKPDEVDFSWLREWRINTPSIPLTYDNCIVVTDKYEEEMQLVLEEGDIDVDAEPEYDGCWTFYYLKHHRSFRCVSIEQLFNIEKLSKAELNKIIEAQKPEEWEYLGSTFTQ